MHVLCQLWLYLLNDVGSDTYIHRRSISCTTTPPIFDPAAKISPREIPLPIFSEGGLKIFNLEFVDDIRGEHIRVFARRSAHNGTTEELAIVAVVPTEFHASDDVLPQVV